jgi:hypothetical protein
VHRDFSFTFTKDTYKNNLGDIYRGAKWTEELVILRADRDAVAKRKFYTAAGN